MVQSILSAVMKDETDPKLRCIVLTAEGNVFSGGHNLKHLAINDGRAVFEHFNVLMQKIIESPVPVIASVDGLAAAAGCQLVAQCDIAICTETSSFSTPGANFGVFCSTPGVALVRNVPRKLAAYMLFTGCPITAEVAQKHGLVSHVLKNHDELEREINRIIDTIKAKSRSVVELGKRFLYKQLDMELKMAYR
ncbi:hypothetical protein AAG570_010901 [Ranatra chinensis]|uniref:Enoyl-CoA hydratase domain-containing protein 3, mitochondrial n=1 Tax=Ranatra chinensis TaxID=642074 RepID=A0ABD0YJ19_9HEMI